VIQRILENIFVVSIKLLASTWRISVEGESKFPKAVIAFWHGKMLPCWKLFSNQNKSAVISLSKDGELLTKLLHSWNYNVLRGSSSTGSKEVLYEMEHTARTSTILITPDGPRGPLHTAKPGAVIVAQRAEVPLVLCKVKVKCKITLKSWDRFEIPLPFSNISIQFLPPIIIDNNANREEISSIIDSCNHLLT